MRMHLCTGERVVRARRTVKGITEKRGNNNNNNNNFIFFTSTQVHLTIQTQ